MSESSEKGPPAQDVRADISDDVIQDALRSVERRAAEAAAAAELENVDPAEFARAREEIVSLKAQLEFSQAKGRELLEKLKEDHERTLRAAADLDNYKRRAAKEREETQKFGNERLLRDFLPIIDNLDRALEHATKAPDADGFRSGVAMTRKLFEDTLAKHGVKAFSAKGLAFDPHLHEAMGQAETTEVPPNHVANEILRGYLLNERLIRPALVMVARAPEKPAPAAVPSDTSESAAPSENGEA